MIALFIGGPSTSGGLILFAVFVVTMFIVVIRFQRPRWKWPQEPHIRAAQKKLAIRLVLFVLLIVAIMLLVARH
jgi:hypothetical protein